MLSEYDIKILRFVSQYGAITINQAYKLYFNKAAYGRDMARKKLKVLTDAGELKCGKIRSGYSNENIYYTTKLPSAHALYLLDYYSNIIYFGADIIEFKREVSYDRVRPDALIRFKYRNMEVVQFVEVVITNQIDYSKYENLKNTEELQKKIGTFPALIVIADLPQQYRGSKLNVKYLGYKMNEFVNTVIP